MHPAPQPLSAPHMGTSILRSGVCDAVLVTPRASAAASLMGVLLSRSLLPTFSFSWLEKMPLFLPPFLRQDSNEIQT